MSWYVRVIRFIPILDTHLLMPLCSVKVNDVERCVGECGMFSGIRGFWDGGRVLVTFMLNVARNSSII